MIRVGWLLVVVVSEGTMLMAVFGRVVALSEFFARTVIRGKQKGGRHDNGAPNHDLFVAGKCSEHGYSVGYSTSRTLSIWLVVHTGTGRLRLVR